jgi:hypothetical protein
MEKVGAVHNASHHMNVWCRLDPSDICSVNTFATFGIKTITAKDIILLVCLHPQEAES